MFTCFICCCFCVCVREKEQETKRKKKEFMWQWFMLPRTCCEEHVVSVVKVFGTSRSCAATEWISTAFIPTINITSSRTHTPPHTHTNAWQLCTTTLDSHSKPFQTNHSREKTHHLSVACHVSKPVFKAVRSDSTIFTSAPISSLRAFNETQWDR